MEKEKNTEKNIDTNRRNFLKILLFGGGTIVLGKVLGPTVVKFFEGPSTETIFQNFKTVENKNGLKIYDKTGEEIFEIDNSATE